MIPKRNTIVELYLLNPQFCLVSTIIGVDYDFNDTTVTYVYYCIYLINLCNVFSITFVVDNLTAKRF